MAMVVAQASVSLDGFICDAADGGFEHLFAWCGNGDVEVPSADPERLTYRVSEASAPYVRDMVENFGANVIGRRFFDLVHGWGGRHPTGVPTFVVTHHAPADWPDDTETPFTFVTDGLQSAIDQAKVVAGDKHVGVGPGTVVWQGVNAGLIDEIRLDLVPIMFGSGTRMFDQLAATKTRLSTPQVIQGKDVTHLTYTLLGPTGSAA